MHRHTVERIWHRYHDSVVETLLETSAAALKGSRAARASQYLPRGADTHHSYPQAQENQAHGNRKRLFGWRDPVTVGGEESPAMQNAHQSRAHGAKKALCVAYAYFFLKRGSQRVGKV